MPASPSGQSPDPHPVFHDLADYMLDGQVQLLDASGADRGDDVDEFGEVLYLTPALAQESDDRHAASLRGLRGAHHVGALAARRVQHEEVFRLRQRLDLAREHLVEPHVVGAGGEERGVGGERHSPQAGATGLVADHVLRGDVLRVGGAAAVAGEVQRPARAQRLLVARRDGGDRVGLLGGNAAREGGEPPSAALPQRLAYAVGRSQARTAWTNASSAGPVPRSTIVPITTKSAPAARAACACSGERIPPPTKSGTAGSPPTPAPPVTARQARITAAGTGRSAPLPASRWIACIPIRRAAIVCAAASSGLSAGSGRG